MEEKVVNEVETEKTQEVAQAEAPQKEQTGDRPNRGNRQNGPRRNFQRRDRRLEPKEYEEKVVAINRVTKVVSGGKRMKFAAVVVIGNGKGKYGFASGKSGEVPDAIKKAVEKAKRNVFNVKIINNSTIAHEVIGKFGATQVFLKPAPEGTGIIAGSAVRAILELTGIKNVYSKVYGSRTPINVIRATNDALNKLKSYEEVKALRKNVEVTSDAK